MSRTVDYLTNASEVIYFPFSGGQVPVLDDAGNETDEVEFDEYLSHEEWEDMNLNLVSAMIKVFPSLSECKRWDGRETRIFLENYLAEFGISEYCGLVSLSVRPVSDDYTDKTGLSEKWISQVWPRVKRILEEQGLTTLHKVATFSNGEAIYSRTGTLLA